MHGRLTIQISVIISWKISIWFAGITDDHKLFIWIHMNLEHINAIFIRSFRTVDHPLRTTQRYATNRRIRGTDTKFHCSHLNYNTGYVRRLSATNAYQYSSYRRIRLFNPVSYPRFMRTSVLWGYRTSRLVRFCRCESRAYAYVLVKTLMVPQISTFDCSL